MLTSQVGGVGGDHDKGEEPPHAGHHTGRYCPEQSHGLSQVVISWLPNDMVSHLSRRTDEIFVGNVKTGDNEM